MNRFEDDPSTFPVGSRAGENLRRGEDGGAEAQFPKFTPIASWASLLGTTFTQKVTLQGDLGLVAYYFEGSPDPEGTKTHERKHVAIWKKWWNMLVDEVSWVETKWCKPCGQLAASYANATEGLRRAQGKIENFEFDVSDYTANGAAQNWIAGAQASLNAATREKDEAQTAYDAAKRRFMTNA